MNVTVKIITAANGDRTPHDGRYLLAWNPHTPYGICEIETTNDPAQAGVFEFTAVMTEWRQVSEVEPLRPTDGQPNRPLTALTIQVNKVEQ